MSDKQIKTHYNPVEIKFGSGAMEELPALLADVEHILLVTTPGFTHRGLTERVNHMCANKQMTVLDDVLPNPDMEYLEEKCSRLKSEGVDIIVALGGGSALDTAKVLSYLLVHPFSLREHLEEGGEVLSVNALPVIAIPTTAGTGSEVTPFATVWDMRNYKKYSFAAPSLFPRFALEDPLLTLTMPEDITVCTGLDALSHALESFWNRNSNPVSQAFATAAVKIVLKALPVLVADLENEEYRAAMLEASLMGGMAISSTRTALAHSMSYPITARYKMPHGLACGFTLPSLWELNTPADPPYFNELASRLGFTTADELKRALDELFEKLAVKERVSNYVENVTELIDLVPQMFTPGRADNNFAQVSEHLVKEVIKKSLA